MKEGKIGDVPNKAVELIKLSGNKLLPKSYQAPVSEHHEES
jgi:hypothetical protein